MGFDDVLDFLPYPVLNFVWAGRFHWRAAVDGFFYVLVGDVI